MVLSDAPIPADSTEALDQQNYWGINVTLVETALSHLLGEGQEVSVTLLPAVMLYTQYSTPQGSANQYCNSAVISLHYSLAQQRVCVCVEFVHQLCRSAEVPPCHAAWGTIAQQGNAVSCSTAQYGAAWRFDSTATFTPGTGAMSHLPPPLFCSAGCCDICSARTAPPQAAGCRTAQGYAQPQRGSH